MPRTPGRELALIDRVDEALDHLTAAFDTYMPHGAWAAEDAGSLASYGD
jgi:hypothetical protein